MAKAKVTYHIAVKDNPNFCGVDACGVQFSNGQADTDNARAAAWFQEHNGYTVTKREAENG